MGCLQAPGQPLPFLLLPPLPPPTPHPHAPSLSLSLITPFLSALSFLSHSFSCCSLATCDSPNTWLALLAELSGMSVLIPDSRERGSKWPNLGPVSQEGTAVRINCLAEGAEAERSGVGTDRQAGSWVWLLWTSPIPLPSTLCGQGTFVVKNHSTQLSYKEGLSKADESVS